ncbi:Fur family peroxide stress response transcriptional regulator [Paenibacillus phyllosphaerae]|uniref:Fur family peroxide stress response transcriptional regulator n=1 Tax=Paenibacillus phyllosphaerae TaxID=274593 RepID=A0A7W5B0T7_9BACL|nr:Fur family transcriptional regulator [Paenibacillus phyllosphaerae]MBB3112339.1 Fur family peroxide stress response transcriptional regulator [Paenibacillus phyllosphaerae]
MHQDMESVLEQLRAKGLRLTPQRVEVIALLYQLSHPTAEQVYSLMAKKFPYVSQTTVYSTLKLLKDQGIVNELTYGDRSSHFELTEDEHAHFNCKVCGGIYDVDVKEAEKLNTMIKTDEQFEVDFVRVEFYGTCKACLTA